MKALICHIILVLCCFAWSASAQQLRWTQQAADQCTAGNYSAAFASIDKAMKDPLEMNQPYAWYVKGFVYKEFYKANESGQLFSKARTTAVQALVRALELDTKAEYAAQSKSALHFLATSYFNDALVRSREVDASNAEECEYLFDQFRTTMKVVNPLYAFTPFELELYKNLGQQHYRLWERNQDAQIEINLAAKAFQKALAIEESDCDVHYNLAIIYYNQAVKRIRKIDASLDIVRLILIQEESVKLFKQALPYMQYTFDHCAPKAEYYRGMMYMSRALGKDEDFEKYQTALQEAVKRGVVQLK